LLTTVRQGCDDYTGVIRPIDPIQHLIRERIEVDDDQLADVDTRSPRWGRDTLGDMKVDRRRHLIGPDR
jgi:hypothetical protein